MSVDLLVSVSEAGIVGQASLQLSLQSSISDILNITLSKLLTDSVSRKTPAEGQEWCLFLPKRSTWLNASQTLGYYNIPENAKLELKRRYTTLKVVLADSTRKTIKLDRLQPVSSVIRDVSEKLRLGVFGQTYGLRRLESKTDDVAASIKSAAFGWMSGDQSLDEQGCFSDQVVFSKRFFDLSPKEELTNVTDEHLSFFEARNQYIGGFFDSVLDDGIAAELSSILLLHRIGCQTLSSSSSSSLIDLIQENLSTIFPPKFLHHQNKKMTMTKKKAGNMISAVSNLYESYITQGWASEPRAVKRRFLLSIVRVPSFGTISFPVDSARCGDAATDYSNVCLVLSSQFLQFRTPQTPSPRLGSSGENHHVGAGSSAGGGGFVDNSGKIQETLYSVTMSRLSRKSAAKNTVSLIADASSPEPIAITIIAENSHVIDEYLAAFLQMRKSTNKSTVVDLSSQQQRQQTPSDVNDAASGRPRSATLTRKISMSQMMKKEINTTSLATAAKSSLQLFDEIQSHLYQIVMQEQQQQQESTTQIDGSQEPSQAPSMTIEQWFSQAGTHLESVSRLSVSLSKQIRLGGGSEKLIGPLVTFAQTVLSIGRCIVKSTDHRMSSQQTICFITWTLLRMCSRLVHQAHLSTASSTTTVSDSTTAELTACERVLPVACGILDVAMRARLCDQSSSICMFICSRDIELCTSSIVSDLRSVPVSTDSLDVDSVSGIFWWYTRLFQAAATVTLQNEAELMSGLSSAISTVSNSATSLLSRLMDKIADLPSSDTFSEIVSQLKWYWACLDQSLKSFKFFASNSATAGGDLDPMLPVVLFELMHAVDTYLMNPTENGAVLRCSGSVVRTMAKQSAFSYSVASVQNAAKLETAIEKFRTATISSPEVTQRNSTRRKSTARGRTTVSKRAGPSAALSLLDLSLLTLLSSEVDEVENHSRSVRHALFAALTLRSTLQTAGGLRGVLARYVNLVQIRSYLEQVDVMLHILLEPLATFFTLASASVADAGLALPAELFAECNAILSSTFPATDEGDSQEQKQQLGFLNSLVRAQVSRVADSLGSLSKDSPRENSQTSAYSSMFVRRGKRASLLLRPSASDPLVTSDASSYETSKSGSTNSIVHKSSDGTVEFLNEAALLGITERLILAGDCPELNLSFKDALEMCSTTFPYWTSAEAFTTTIVSALVTGNATSIQEGDIYNVGTRVSVALSKLLRLHPAIVQDPPSRMAVNSALAKLKSLGGKAEAAVVALEDTIRESLEHIARSENLATLHRAVLDSTRSDPSDLLTVDLQVLANQLTLVEQRFMETVAVPDLMNSAWTKKQNNALSAWITHSNDISLWLASRILQLPKRRDRFKLISRLIKLADLLREMNNFSSMLTIFLTLSMECISRLKKTWDLNGQILANQFTKLKEEIRPMQNFSGYREKLKKALQSPCIPYPAVLMRDVVMLEEVLSETPEASGCIMFNVSHLETLSRVLHTQFFSFSKKARFALEEDAAIFPEILNPLAFGLLDEDSLMARAAEMESSAKSKPKKQRTVASPLHLPSLDTIKRSPSGEILSPSSSSSSSSSSSFARSQSLYGVRSMATPRSPSSPRTAAATASDSQQWKRQANLLASACESAATSLSRLGKLRVASMALSVSDLFSSALKLASTGSNDTPRSSALPLGSSPRSGGEEETVAMSALVKDMTILLSHICDSSSSSSSGSTSNGNSSSSRSSCTFDVTQAASTFKSWTMTRENAVIITAIAIQSIKSIQGEIMFSGRINATLDDKRNNHAQVSLDLLIPSRDWQYQSVESTIAASLPPSLSRALSRLEYRVTHGISGKYHSTVSITFTAQVQQQN